MSKLARAAITVTVTQTPISWRRLGTRDGDELAQRPGAVEPGRLVERRVDLAHAGQQQQRAQAEQHPCADHADRRQRGVEVAQPGAGHAAEADARRAAG